MLVAHEELREAGVLRARARSIPDLACVGKAQKRVFDSGVAVVPCALGSRAEDGVEMVGAALGRVEETAVLALGQAHVRHAHLDEVAHHVELVVVWTREVLLSTQRMERVDVTARLLRGEEELDPLLELRAQIVVRPAPFGVVARIDLERKADGLCGVVRIRVAPRAALELDARLLACVELSRGHEVQQLLAAPALLHLADAVRQPLYRQLAVFGTPEPAHLHLLLRHLQKHAHIARRRVRRRRESRCGDQKKRRCHCR